MLKAVFVLVASLVRARKSGRNVKRFARKKALLADLGR